MEARRNFRRGLYYLNIYIYFLKRKFSENVLQDAPNKIAAEYTPKRTKFIHLKKKLGEANTPTFLKYI